ncbi:MAG: diphthine--ammonia ligase [Candidatus Bathyarchaeota archaeon]|nr:diphthine--ammonia ligase [Candidatus Bathyarchaeota archaeon]
MKLGVLFSGGKDSTVALHKAAQKNKIKCLITLISKNIESYMFHTPNINITELQSEALGIPIINKNTMGNPEEELKDLEEAILTAIKKFKIKGIVTGAIASVYQTQRIQKICDNLSILCINPLWKKNQELLLREIIQEEYKVIISGIFAYPLTKSWLGKLIDNQTIDRLISLNKKFGLSISGEGGEIETTVLDAPLFTKRIEITDFIVNSNNNSGVFTIKKARLVSKL